jgi:hypothetical protein
VILRALGGSGVLLLARELCHYPKEAQLVALLIPPLQSPRARSETIPPDGVRKSCWLSFQAESGGAGHGAWEISPATRPECTGRL